MGIAIIVPDCDFSSANLGKVTLTGRVPITALSISGLSVVNGSTYQYSAVYTPSNTTERGVIWTIESGSAYAAIGSETGNLAILPNANNAQVVIKATSTANSSIYATKTVTVTYSSSNPLEVYDEGQLALVSDGTAYINAVEFFTGAKRWNTIALKMEIVFKIYETGSDNLHIFGISSSTGTGASRKAGYLDAVYLGGQSKLRFGGDGSPDIFSDTSNIANSLYKFSSIMNDDYTSGNITIEKNGNVLFTQPIAGCDTIATDIFPLFARNTNGGSGFSIFTGAANVGIYSFKLATQAGGDVCEIYPCLYNGTPAAYDAVSNQVMTTLGTGGTFHLLA